MSGIRQYQRRAIEAFVGEPEAIPPPSEAQRQKYVLTTDGICLFPLGVSVGEGSCSDIYGMNVLVVSEFEPGENAVRDWAGRLANLSCVYTVEYRTPTAQEIESSGFHPSTALACVELLRPLDTVIEGVIFERTNKVQVYANVIG
ncbi:hypothetical protein BVY00_00530 [bacterium G20]|nr:hypothetical protein BVY00_00530 [bacterium G20]